MAITAGMVMALRKKTGLPMMECKQALEEAGGDEQKAIDLMRKKGMGQLSKRADRETSQGLVSCYVDSDTGQGGIVELLCETAPVAGTEDFMNLAARITRQAAAMDAPTPESILEHPCLDDASRKISDVVHDVVNRLRENVKIARVGRLTGHLGKYTHHNSQVGVLVRMSADCPAEVRADVCMHIAAMRPQCTRREQVDAESVEKERQLAIEQAQGKPENIIEKIVTGKLNRWYSEIVLLEQPFVKDDKQSVGQMLMGVAPELTVQDYLRFEVGGS
ncbi:MAG: translation elongation factor Ts [Planctomycetota bacterium]